MIRQIAYQIDTTMKKALLGFMMLVISSIGFSQTNPTITGDTMMCPWTDGTAFVKNPIYDTYQWYFKYWFLNDPFTPIEGATQSSFTYDWYTYDQALFFVKATKDGIDYQSDTIQIDSYAWLPLEIMLEMGNNVTFNPETQSYELCRETSFTVHANNPPYDTLIQWYNNGAPISGATNATYVISEAGSYYVEAAPSFCPGSVSSTAGIPIDVIIVDCGVGVPSLSPADINIYPNPCSGHFNLSNSQAIQLTGEIYSSTGKLVKSFTALPGENQIEIENLSPGIYLVKMVTSDKTDYKKIIVK